MSAPYIPTGLCFPPGQPGIVLVPPKGMEVAAADYTGFTENQQIEFRNALNEHMLLITSIDGMPVPERFPLLWMRAARQNQMSSLIDGFNPPMEQLQMPGGSPQPQYSWTSGVQDIQGANWASAGPADASLPVDIPPLDEYALVQSAPVSSEPAAPVAVSTTIDPVLLGIEPEVPTMGLVLTDVELAWEDIDPILLEIDSFNWDA
ncbi:hypothetical protein ACET3X_002154 [Alternaria dauci]|uniref:Uncharacterized protein n=1 Tax=Alternaria dauci TaxID=48095 RepID=A0ABR3UPC9_9PLEO